MIRFLTAGESHGNCLSLIIEGIPAGLELSKHDIDRELKRRQAGYGRGGRMKIESDMAEITSGVRAGLTLGSPIAMIIQNRDWENWREIMSSEVTDSDQAESVMVTRPRPGHADLAGGIKYRQKDLRNILERASARETAARVAVGAVAKRLLAEFDIFILSFVVRIGKVSLSDDLQYSDLIRYESIRKLESSPLRCPDAEAEKRMMEAIDMAKAEGNSLGGVFQVMAFGVPPGFGSYVQWDRRLDAKIACAIMSIPAIKGVEIGMGFESAQKKGSEVHDEIFYTVGRGFYHKTNNAGGLEGGITNGETIVIKAAMKPIPTLANPLKSVDFITKEPFNASKERSDVCAVPSAGVVGEAVVAIEIANALLEKFGGDAVSEIKQNFSAYKDYLFRL